MAFSLLSFWWVGIGMLARGWEDRGPMQQQQEFLTVIRARGHRLFLSYPKAAMSI